MPRRTATPRPTPGELGAHALRVAEIGDNPNLIPGIHHYCDRWCERCPHTIRCLSFQLEQARLAVQAAARRDATHRAFWSHLTRQLTLKLRRLEREARPTPSPPVTGAPDPRRPGPGWHLSHHATTLLRLAEDYRQRARESLVRLPLALTDVQRELQTQAQLGTGDPAATARDVRDALEVAEWFVFFIEAKLKRAMTARVEEAEDATARPLSDADGSAKIALIAIDRSTAAWTTLREHCAPEADAILDLLALLERLRRTAEDVFPRARGFQRPGFD